MSQVMYKDDRAPTRLALLSVVMFAVVSCMAGALFWVSETAHEHENRIQAMNRALLNERQAIRVLDAEWAYLTRPQRVEKLVAMRNGAPDEIQKVEKTAVAIVQAAAMVDVPEPVKKQDVVVKAEPVKVTPVKAAPVTAEPVRKQAAVDVWPIERKRPAVVAAPKAKAQKNELYRPASVQGRAGMRPIVE